ncbi:MAG: PfkB family carbohydrate kinase, partial [Planctomycetaceae bacterium]
PGANGQLTTGDVQAAADIIRSADVVLLQFEVPMPVILETIRIVRSTGNARIIVDPAPASSGELPAEIYQADWMCPNETEAEALCRRTVHTPEEAKDAVLWLRNVGVRNPVVTLGSQGIAWRDETGTCRIMSPFVVSAVDTTAAGDAFAGALGVALGEGLADREALRFASATGALATTRPGAQPAMPTREMVNELLISQPESTGI